MPIFWLGIMLIYFFSLLPQGASSLWLHFAFSAILDEHKTDYHASILLIRFYFRFSRASNPIKYARGDAAGLYPDCLV